MSEHSTAPEPDGTTEVTPLPPWLREAIGGCRLKRVIASGGMGTVYEAVQEHPRRTVAVKVMKHGVTSRSALRRFETESQILGRLRHPNIAQVHEAGTHEGGGGTVPFFVMEYIPNAMPITRYARERSLGTRERLELFEQVCAAIHHGHQKGIIHRDLKPGNVLVDADGNVKIIDFGVARATDSDLAVTTLQTDVGQLLGTLQYMSPEQVEADPHAIDARSDVYALGVVLYELLCDRLPYDVSRMAIFEATRVIREDPPSKLSSFNKHLRGDIETLVMKAVEKDRGRRYQSADAMRLDIERYLNDEPILAQPPTFGYMLARRSEAFLHRHPIVSYLGVVAVVCVLVELLLVDVVYYQTGINQTFKRWMAGVPALGTRNSPLRHVAVVRITDDTIAASAELAREHGVEGSDGTWGTMRALHGALLKRLATINPRVVSFDITFQPEKDEIDPEFVEGIRAVREAGGDVLVSIHGWRLGDGLGRLSRHLRPYVRPHGVTGGYVETEDWFANLFVDRGGDIMPSLMLATCGAHRYPGRELLVAPAVEDEAVNVQYFTRPEPNNPSFRDFVPGVVDVFELSAVEIQREDDYGREVGDRVGIYIFRMPPDDALEQSSVDYEWVLGADDIDLQRRFGGKAIVVGDCRSEAAGNGDYHPTPDGRRLPGCYAVATVADRLIRSAAPIRIESATVARVALGAAGLLGALIVGATVARPRRRVVLFVLVFLTVPALSVLSYHVRGTLHNPALPLLAFVLTFSIIAGLDQLRLRRMA
ncbi:MAG: protein kinase domain-containing protein [Planctomycetota bacterium]|jgi:CHASE2 domain-containing sensor protein/serine/threonine-protein kinase RIO1